MSNMAIAYQMKKKAKKMAEGGAVDPMSEQSMRMGAEQDAKDKHNADVDATAEDSEVAAKMHRYADGGKVTSPNGPTKPGNPINYPEGASLSDGGSVDDDGIINRIMVKMSKGGQVANETPITADFRPNEFDDLVLRDGLTSDYGDDDNSGDALGNEQEDEDQKDIVSRVMRSRAKKDRMPRPA